MIAPDGEARELRDQLRLHLRAHLQRLAADGTWALAVPARASTPVTSGVPGTSAVPVTAAGADAAAVLEQVAVEARACTACPLYRGRNQVVVGVGDPRARLMFIGEGPGREEDRQGEPFVGAAGKKLDDMIAAMKMRRRDVYIANAVKCRPPDNRNPEPDELQACRPYLLRQIAAIRPEVIVLLGKVAARALLGTEDALARLRGRFMEFDGIPVMCTYHPAFLLRKPEYKRQTWQDLQMVMGLLAGPSS